MTVFTVSDGTKEYETSLENSCAPCCIRESFSDQASAMARLDLRVCPIKKIYRIQPLDGALARAENKNALIPTIDLSREESVQVEALSSEDPFPKALSLETENGPTGDDLFQSET